MKQQLQRQSGTSVLVFLLAPLWMAAWYEAGTWLGRLLGLTP